MCFLKLATYKSTCLSNLNNISFEWKFVMSMESFITEECYLGFKRYFSLIVKKIYVCKPREWNAFYFDRVLDFIEEIHEATF